MSDFTYDANLLTELPEGALLPVIETGENGLLRAIPFATYAQLLSALNAGASAGFNRSVTDYTGGGPTKLDGIPTAGLSVPRTVSFLRDNGLASTFETFDLVAGNSAEASPNIIRPDDYVTGSNQKIWLRRYAASLRETTVRMTSGLIAHMPLSAGSPVWIKTFAAPSKILKIETSWLTLGNQAGSSGFTMRLLRRQGAVLTGTLHEWTVPTAPTITMAHVATTDININTDDVVLAVVHSAPSVGTISGLDLTIHYT